MWVDLRNQKFNYHGLRGFLNLDEEINEKHLLISKWMPPKERDTVHETDIRRGKMGYFSTTAASENEKG